jgi:hypothetical protein
VNDEIPGRESGRGFLCVSPQKQALFPRKKISKKSEKI